MKKIGAYELLTPLQTAGSGSARWCIARRGQRRFFLKEFLSPVYPAENANPVLREKQLARCRRFEEKKRRLYSAMSCVIGDTLVPVTDFFRFGLHYYAVSEEIPEPRLTGESAVETLPMEDKREILLSLALCLQRLHLQGIVHADLKPEHVLLRKGELGYEARLIDLDSGFLADDPPAPGGDTEGDPVYLAPENLSAHGRRAGRRGSGHRHLCLWGDPAPHVDRRFAGNGRALSVRGGAGETADSNIEPTAARL